MTCSDVRSGRSPAVQACKGVHPYPMPFQKSVILWPGVKYRLSLNMKWMSCSEGESKLLNLIFVFHRLFHNVFVATKRSLSHIEHKPGRQYPKNLPFLGMTIKKILTSILQLFSNEFPIQALMASFIHLPCQEKWKLSGAFKGSPRLKQTRIKTFSNGHRFTRKD